MAATVIIGYGNPLRRDDGLGPAAAELLACAYGGSGVDVIVTQELTADLAEPIARIPVGGRVLFIDAALPGRQCPPTCLDRADQGDGLNPPSSRPGQVDCHPVGPPAESVSSMTHHLAPADLCAAAEAVYGRRPEAWLLTVVGADFDVGQGLSPAVSAALPALLNRCEDLIAGAEIHGVGCR